MNKHYIILFSLVPVHFPLMQFIIFLKSHEGMIKINIKKAKKSPWPNTPSPLNLNVKAHIILIKYTRYIDSISKSLNYFIKEYFKVKLIILWEK